MTDLLLLLALNAIVALPSITDDSVGQDLQVYKHPSLNIQFQATRDWRRVPRPEDETIYEVADPKGAVHVVLWYTTTEQDDEGGALPSLQEILQRYVEAVGGREAIGRLTTRVMTGRLVTDLPSRRPPVHESNRFSIFAKTPGRYLLVQQSESGTHRDGYDGETCWKASESEVERDVRCDRRFAWFADPRGATRLREYFPEMKLQGMTTLEGRSTYRVDIDDDPSHALYFDAETGLLVRLGYNRELSDYREVDDIRVPFRMAISRKGGASTYVFERIEHNVPLDDARFVPSVPY